MSEISGEQAIELGTVGGAITLRMAEEARDFCVRHGLDAGPNQVDHFNAAVFCILETVIFMAISGAYEDPQTRQQVATEVLRGTRRLLKAWSADRRSTVQ